MKVLLFGLSVIALLSFRFDSSTFSDVSEKPTIDTTKLVARHNYYRQQVGAPDIHWSDELAAYAQAWADKLAKNCQLQHSNGEYGENIYWHSDVSNEEAVVDYWAEEEQYFNHKNTTYVSGRGHKSGHYSQVIWAKSTKVGAGVANCKGGGQIWVCVYDPAGNVIGEKAY